MKYINLILISMIMLVVGCSTAQREFVARNGATYATVRLLKKMNASAAKADKIKDIAELALSGNQEDIKTVLEKVIKSDKFSEEEQIIMLTFLDDLSKVLADLANTDGEVIILIKATAEGVIIGVEIHKRSLSGQLIPIYVV